MRSRLADALAARSVRLNSQWICRDCRARTRVRWQHSASSTEKPYYITTPIYYVNAGNYGLDDPVKRMHH